jgi:hypothetical protein
LRWTKWRWVRFSPSTSVSPANLHSTKFSIIIITRGRYNRPFSGQRAEWTQLGLHPPLCELKKILNYALSDASHTCRDGTTVFWLLQIVASFLVQSVNSIRRQISYTDSSVSVIYLSHYVPTSFSYDLRQFYYYFAAFFFFVWWDLRHQVLRPLLAYCTSPDDR